MFKDCSGWCFTQSWGRIGSQEASAVAEAAIPRKKERGMGAQKQALPMQLQEGLKTDWIWVG